MRWDDVFTAISSVAAADPVLASIYRLTDGEPAENIRMAGTAEHVVPCLEYQLIADSLQPDIWEPHIIQWDQWVDNLQQLAASERALERLFHHDGVVLLGGVYMWSVKREGVNLVSPNRSNYTGRGVRFEMKPVMEQYVEPVGS